jgi:glycosyltransferase involved in cell wall biosynthesis
VYDEVIMKLAIIVPAYNEEETIAEVIARLRALPMDKELIVVNDASTDGTAKVLASLAGPDLVILTHPKNRGKGAAIRTAIAAVTAPATVIQDADLEYLPEELPRLLEPVASGRADVVYGTRFRGVLEGMRFANYLCNKGLAWMASILYGQWITDEATCYKLFRTEVLKSLPLVCERFEFCPEVTARVRRRGIRILELPITYQGRTVAAGKKIRLIDAWEAFVTLLRLRFARAA